MCFAYGAAWIATSTAVIYGIHLTGNELCLWALFIPAMISINPKSGKD